MVAILYEGKAFRAPEARVDGAALENETEFPQIGVESFGAFGDPDRGGRPPWSPWPGAPRASAGART